MINVFISNDFISALSLVLAVYAFVTALLLFVAQTKTYNRVVWYTSRNGKFKLFEIVDGKRKWFRKKGWTHGYLALFNTSRRHLVKDEIYKPLAFYANGLKVKSIKDFGDVEGRKLLLDHGKRAFDFQYMEPGSSIVVELEANGSDLDLEPRGVVNNGRKVRSFFFIDTILHSWPFNVILYIVVPIVLGFILWRKAHNQLPLKVFLVYVIGMAILFGGLYWFFHNHRRIKSKDYLRVKKYIKSKGLSAK